MRKSRDLVGVDLVTALILAHFVVLHTGCTAFGGSSLSVEGRLVDTGGQPVANSAVTITEFRNVLPGEDGGTKTYRLKSDYSGNFTWEASRHVGSLLLTFLHRGYHPETIELNADSSPENGDPAPDVLGQGRSRTYSWRDLQVVLTRIGPTTELDERQGRLSLNADGSGRVFTYDRADREVPLRYDAVDEGFETLPDVRPTHPLVEPGIKLEASVINGRFESAEHHRERGSDGLPVRLPGSVKLTAFGNNAGFVRYDSTQQLQGKTIRGRHLLEAPTTGYQRDLSFSADELLHLTRGGGHVYFYVRLGDKFGRGRVERLDWNGGFTELTAILRIQMQPDGSRNLETGERF